ncbi:hypothetical protein CKO28_14190 [Rhodovibrio sodomensis]|uniref:Uncharacterized protein n=1 Tax=Rhodovibrio sodomensis TaxID=1088 RepID=A0ABS1DI42_9PROT|nr:hypothetical protein [Rhodovibrio sodomensis]MBK1669183.1 hypothetical protein [Rhodovibrio sodomensis]
MSRKNIGQALGRVQQVSATQAQPKETEAERSKRLAERERRAEQTDAASRTYAPNQPAPANVEAEGQGAQPRKPAVRHTISMPTEEDELLHAIFQRLLYATGKPIKNSEVLRMGLLALAEVSDDEELVRRYEGLQRLKPGRQSRN